MEQNKTVREALIDLQTDLQARATQALKERAECAWDFVEMKTRGHRQAARRADAQYEAFDIAQHKVTELLLALDDGRLGQARQR